MGRITKTITFSLPPDMADTVEEIMRQEGCAATSRSASGDGSSDTVRTGSASKALIPETWNV